MLCWGQVHEKLVKTWLDLQTARDGTIKNWLYKLAQAVLSREDPTETFLKSVAGCSVEVLYPVRELSARVILGISYSVLGLVLAQYLVPSSA
jgi:Mitochondrial K+-H+ exchange-related